MTAPQKRLASAGLVLFVALSFLGSWFVAAALRVFELNVAPAALGTRLLTTSILYAITMGWQPLVAAWVVRRWLEPRDGLDFGLRAAPRVFGIVGAVGALGISAAAAAIAWGAASLGAVDPTPFGGTAEVELAASAPSNAGIIVLLLAFAATVSLVSLQAFTEEIGWRGYFLPRAMERFGRWRGLLLHGAVWGAWYAPVLFFATYGQVGPFFSVARSLGVVVTCILFGTLLGWLRLASKSLAPVVIANTTLTLAAGLPYVVHGVDAGIRSAAFGPAGWALLLAVIAALSFTKWRHSIQTPEHLGATAPSTGLAMLDALAGRPRGQTLH